MGYVIMVAQFVLSLSILIILHEMGHFLPAKWFKTRVEKFYLFFDPWFSLFKKKIGETEYGVGWLPLGGYVKISGMIDESMDREQMKSEPKPWEFRSKPAWQRLIIMLGGVTVNFILGFLIFAAILFVWGHEYMPAKNITYGYTVDSIAAEIGLQEGDQILKLGNQPYEKYDVAAFKKAIVIDDVKDITVLRDGQEEIVAVEDKYVRLLSSYAAKNAWLFAPRFPVIINETQKNSPADEAGLMPGDQIIGINGEENRFYNQFSRKMRDIKNEEVELTLLREGREFNTKLVTTKEGQIGIYPKNFVEILGSERQEYSVLEALPAGVTEGIDFLTSQIKAFGKMFSGKIKASESLGGFGTISNLFPRSWDWERFWHVTGILSLILGFMNLLPIPALDGGHVMFLIYEAITGRKLSDKFMEYATIVGFAIVITLVLYANGLDVLRWINGR